ncbi:MAG: hypothetical protein GF315_05390 [candidate division Zixibacteria bacterium]|nr:hypothetical protein [candidate division Zixibacteria bacterium]
MAEINQLVVYLGTFWCSRCPRQRRERPLYANTLRCPMESGDGTKAPSLVFACG